jgi:predicted kinase
MSGAQSHVVLTCGLAGSGKTTFAKQLEASGFVRLSIDDEVWRRISTGVLTPEADTRLVSLSIEEEIRARLVDLIRQGRDVVVDFSFPARSSRDAYKRIVEDNGGTVELVYFRLSPEVAHARARQDALDTASSPSARVTVDRYIPSFEEPEENEGAIVIDAYSGGVH